MLQQKKEAVSDVRHSAPDAFSKNGMQMYAVPIILMNPKTGQPVPGSGQIYHIHADSVEQALLHYKAVFPNRRTHHIVGASVCIGYFIADKKGEVVSAT